MFNPNPDPHSDLDPDFNPKIKNFLGLKIVLWLENLFTIYGQLIRRV